MSHVKRTALLLTPCKDVMVTNTLKKRMNIQYPNHIQGIVEDVVFYHIRSIKEGKEAAELIRTYTDKKFVFTVHEEDADPDMIDLILLPVHGIIFTGHLSRYFGTILGMLEDNAFPLEPFFQTVLCKKLIRHKEKSGPISSFVFHRKACDVPLSKTEILILTELANGLTTKMIVEKHHYAPSTVYINASSLIRKFGAKDRTDAVVNCIRRGFLVPVYDQEPSE
ncbi:response regulator transcription factor [Salisediminibacterium selenitireducens]|uniref:Transcriptional regulator, LuxR family n=1 Tax=Bacillus selenitireducens (strain ATCC 700615 / DSM 15326 / MLS10) TaxID=439292 RepID=D6Y058_BACIE|nr:helix-turn-helix transcriptional regulator [Salisediminibacterium selenitireducens]ADH98449.1 transcriptional regulator, LuxR family [[Bacillus] selenitireducens MLS10]